MIGINVNPRRDFVSARYGQFASSTNTNKSSGARSSKTKTSSSFRRSNSNFRHESHNDDFMSKLKDSASLGNVYIPSNGGVESVDINNYVENLLM